MNPAPALAAENLNAWYGAAQVLYDISLTIGRGEVVALMGRNGAGKSTTMKAVMGLIGRRSGMVRINGHDVSRLRPFEIARLGVGFVPEDRRIFSELTVEENLDIGRQPPRHFADGVEAPAWTSEALFKLFPNLAELRQRPGGRMSGGEQQMLTIARTLMGNPLVVLLDEPSEGDRPAHCGSDRRHDHRAEEARPLDSFVRAECRFRAARFGSRLHAGKGPDLLGGDHDATCAE